MALAKAGFSLGIRPVASLRPHEEVIRRHVEQLSSEIRKDGFQRDPIIIDRESATILDGMHRLAAFQVLGVENAVCCAVDYSSRSITLGSWGRVFTVKEGEAVGRALESLPGLRRARIAEAFSAIQNREAGIAVLTPDAAYVSPPAPSVEEVKEAIASMDALAEERGWQRSFVPEDEADVPLQHPRKFVVLPRRLTKDDVVSSAMSGKLFPCKTSMHIIDPRPVAVNLPLEMLPRAKPADLKDAMKGREGRMLPAGSTYGGRRYKERLLVLDRD